MLQTPDSWAMANIGRFILRLPPSSVLNQQIQVLDGITVTVEDSASGESMEKKLEKRRAAVSHNPDSPIVAVPRWTPDTGAVLYVLDSSLPNYYQIEAERTLAQTSIVAVTSGDKSKVELMQKIVRRILGNYVPGDYAPGTFSRFGMKEGSLHQSFGDAEDVRAVFSLPQPGITLAIDSSVVAVPAKMDAFEREEQAVAVSKRDGLVVDVLRRTVAMWPVSRVWRWWIRVSRKMQQYDAHFEAPGAPNSASQTYLQIHLATDDRQPSGVYEKQFLELWDTILDSFKVAP